MQPLKRFLKASFRSKVLVPVIIIMTLLVMVMMWFMEFRVRLLAQADAQVALNTDDTIFGYLRVKNYIDTRRILESIAKRPNYTSLFVQGVSENEPKSIADQLERIYGELQNLHARVSFVRFTPVPWKSPAGTSAMIFPPDETGALTAASRASVRNALTPEVDLMPDTAFVDNKSGGRLYNIISVRMYEDGSTNSVQLGVLTVGEEVTAETLPTDYEHFTGKPIVFLGNGHTLISTFPNHPSTGVFDQKYAKPAAEGQDTITVDRRHYYCTTGKLAAIEPARAAGYILFSPSDLPDTAVTAQQELLVIVIMGILIGSAMVRFFINKATEPLRDLHDAAEAVGRGDFSKRVNIQSKDEFGELGHAFNQMTENIEQSQSQLKQTVDTLKNTQAQLIQSEKLSAVGEFVAGVAHELNNPLAAVMGFSEMLKNADVGEPHARHLDLIYKSAQRCQKIVQSLLSFARRTAPERKPVLVNKLIEDVLEMIAYPLRTSNVKVITHFSHKLPLVMADGHQIQQVVLNIINNARQAIESHADSGRIIVTTNHDERCVRIIIQDNGPGISPENMKRLFDPFFTTKEVGKGTGLGLSLCYGMIHEHGGTIIPSSQPGEGATFTIELPIAVDTAWFESAFAGHASTAGNGAGKGNTTEGANKKVLVVDDEESLLRMIKEHLSQHKYDVTTAPNGETALRTLRETRFDAIICDLKMPGLNGRQVYERLREENPETCRRMIFVTGDIIGDNLKNFLDAEQRPCLCKPFALGELRDKVRETAGKG